MKIKSMDETEGWTQFPELEPDDHLAFQPQMVSMAAWVAEGEREVARRRTKEGLGARARGNPGRRRSLSEHQVQMTRRMKDTGASGRKTTEILEVNEKTVWNALRAGP